MAITQSGDSQLMRLKRGDFICILTTGTHSYVSGPSKTYTYYRFGRVRGVSDGLVTTYFDHTEQVRDVPWRTRGHGRSWGIAAADVNADAFWEAIKARGDVPFETFEEALAFAKQFKRP